MKLVRRIHGWLGLVFAPSIVIFALSGIFQLYGCHEGEGGDTPAGWVTTIAQIHMKQTTAAPRRRAPRPAPAATPADGTASDGAPDRMAPSRPAGSDKVGADKAGGPSGGGGNTGPIKFFFLLMSLGLMVSSGLGVWIALVSKRDRLLHAGLLATGVVVPILLLLL